MYNESLKSKKLRKSHNNPVPIRFGPYKPHLQAEAFEIDQSMHWLVRKIIKDYFAAKGIKMEVVVDD